MGHIKLFEQFISEAKAPYLELIGPDVDELLDAVNKLNGAQMSGKSFDYRDHIKLKPIDKSGHVIARNKYSLEVIPEKFRKTPPDMNTYVRAANSFLEEIGLECKLYQTS